MIFLLMKPSTVSHSHKQPGTMLQSFDVWKCGAGPTQSGALDVSKDVAAKAWQNLLVPDADSRLVDLEIRALAAAARCISGACSPRHRILHMTLTYKAFILNFRTNCNLTCFRGADGRHDKQLAQAVRALLERAAASPSQLPSAKRIGRRSSQAETWDVQWSALSAARASLRGGSTVSPALCRPPYACC